MFKRLVNLAVLAVLLYIGFVIIASKFGEQDQKQTQVVQKEVNVYSSRKEELMQDLFDQFTASTGIDVNFVVDKAPKLIAKLQSEGNNSPADLFLTSDIGNLEKAKGLNLLRPVSSDVLDANIPVSLRDGAGYWYGLSKRVRAIFYAKGRVTPDQLSTYEDLADSKWQGKILIRSSNNIYNQSLLASLIATHGKVEAENWVKSLIVNFARKPQGGDTDQLRALAAGEGDIAIANSYYYGRLQASDDEQNKEIASKIAIFFPNQDGRGAHVNISGGGITASAKNIGNATKLLEFLSAKEAQTVYAKRNHEFPVMQGVEVSDIIKSWGTFKADTEGLLKFPQYIADAVRTADVQGWR